MKTISFPTRSQSQSPHRVLVYRRRGDPRCAESAALRSLLHFTSINCGLISLSAAFVGRSRRSERTDLTSKMEFWEEENNGLRMAKEARDGLLLLSSSSSILVCMFGR